MYPLYMLLSSISVVLTATIGRNLFNDERIRKEHYTEPLARMPENIRHLFGEMMDEAAKEEGVKGEDLEKREMELWKMFSEGASAQRNFELDKTRERISYIGRFISEFMKKEGLSYVELEKKYEQFFKASEREGHQKIIEAASRSNPNLFLKFCNKLLNRMTPGASSEMQPHPNNL